MKPDALTSKARQALKSAEVLLAAGDADGACNRAYYAMFDAARAALLASGAVSDLQSARTHSGLITTFSLHLVKSGKVSIDLGKSLNRVEELRLIADYKGDPIEQEDAAWAVNQAQVFVTALGEAFPWSLPGS